MLATSGRARCPSRGAPASAPARRRAAPAVRRPCRRAACRASAGGSDGGAATPAPPLPLAPASMPGAPRFWPRAAFASLLLAGALCLSALAPPAAHAARSSGRMGGSSFSSASRGSFGGGASLFSSPSSALRTTTHHHTTVIAGGAPTSALFWGGGWGFGGPVVYGGGGGGFGSLIITIVLAAFAVNAVMGLIESRSGSTSEGEEEEGSERIAVCRLQVGLLGLARQLQLDLERIADRADTSSRDGLHYVLTETAMSLLRHPEYCVLGSGGAKACRGPADAEARFNELSVEERSRAPEETLVNVASRRRRAAAAGVNPADAGANELIVVTILVAAEGRLSLPRVSNLEELQGALRKLAALPRSAVQAVEVIWTPQEAGDVLTRDEATRMYPKLNSL